MLSESHFLIRRMIRFLALPYCYFKLVNWKECSASRLQVIIDLLYIFFKLKTFPDNYSPCRLWELDRELWKYYYGSSYHPYQRKKLRKEVQQYAYQILYNDKSVCDQLCKGIGIKLPVTFGIIKPKDDYHKKIQDVFRDSGAEKLIIKPIMGHAGQGIILAIKNGSKITIRTKNTEIELNDFILKDISIIQEILTQDDRISSLSSSSINTIRVVTMYTKSNDVIVLSSSMRFGVGNSYVDNWSAGGIAVGVDHKTGMLMKIAYDKYGNMYEQHPTSKKIFNGFKIPMWDQIIEIALRTQEYNYFYKLLGMDIALTKEGPALVEINANPDLIFQEQTAGPLLKDNRILVEFAEYDLLVNHYQEKLLLNNNRNNRNKMQ
jgi:hypothetical protein